MTAFGLVMLGKLVLLFVFVYFFAVVASLCLNPAVSLSLFSSLFFFFLFFLFFFLSLLKMSTRCSSAKALSFWRKERSH